MDENVLPSKLLTVLHTAAERIRGHDFIHVFSHNDVDGISSAGILATMLQRLGKEYQVTIVPAMDGGVLEQMRSSTSACLLLSDIGASHIDELERLDKDVVVLDHHPSDDGGEKVVHANPHLHGVDGATGACGATMSFLLSITVDQSNWDLVQLALVGLSGDRQHVNGLSGFNTLLLKGGEERGFVTRTPGSLIPSGQLSNSLFSCTEPFIRGVTGNEPGAQRLLRDAGISNDKAYKDLLDDEKWKLSSLMAVMLSKQGVTVKALEAAARTRYVLKDWSVDAEALGHLIHSCGSAGRYGTGVGLCLGDDRCFEDALQESRSDRGAIVEAVNSVDGIGLTQMENIQFFEISRSGSTGVVCGIVMDYLADPSKPVIAVNTGREPAKVTSRGTWALVGEGLDLTSAMRDAAESVGGSGGGHRIASGASIPADKESAFLLNLDGIVGEQLRGAR